MTIRLNGALSRCLAGFDARRALRLRLRSLATAQWLPPPWGAAFRRRDRTESRGAGLRVDRAAHTPAGDLYRRRQRRPGRLSAPHHRREKRTNPRALPRARPEFGGPGSPPETKSLASSALRASGRRWAGHSPTRPSPRRRRNRPTAVSERPYSGGHQPVRAGAAPAGAKPNQRSLRPHTGSGDQGAPTVNPPLPPPAPRETAKADGSGAARSRLVRRGAATERK